MSFYMGYQSASAIPAPKTRKVAMILNLQIEQAELANPKM
jgi:hypothetical protein